MPGVSRDREKRTGGGPTTTSTSTSSRGVGKGTLVERELGHVGRTPPLFEGPTLPQWEPIEPEGEGRGDDGSSTDLISGLATAPTQLVVDGARTLVGQMQKEAFLGHLQQQIVSAANATLGRLASATACPYIEKAFEKYRALPAAQGLAMLYRWVPATRNTSTAEEMIPLVLERVRDGITHWMARGTLPADLAAADPALAAQAQNTAVAKGAGLGSLDDVEAKLGTGDAVDARVAGRMGAAGVDVSHARVHRGPTAAGMAAEQNATAFAVGNNIVMGSGAPPAGTGLGDALLAHELAHVAQQRDASADPAQRKRPIGEEDQQAEINADAVARGAATGKATWDDVLKTGLQLQRCADTVKSPTDAPVKQLHTPPAQMMKVAGDWFQVTWDDDGFSALTVKYEGPLETGIGGIQTRLRVDYERLRLMQPKVTAEADDRIVYDLFGDNSQRVILTARARPWGANEREVRFSASINGEPPPEFAERALTLKLPEAGKPAPPGLSPELAKREAPISKAIELGGDEFTLTARKFGDTKQVQLAITGQRETFAGMADLHGDLVDLAQMPERLVLNVDDRGRDLFIDLDGDRKPDARLSHTMKVEPRFPMDGKGVKQLRTHFVRVFDKDGVFVRQHQYESYGEPGTIPKGQDEAVDAPDLNAPWPNDRPPGQGDVPGQQPEAIPRQGGIVELRIDGDGDRGKELMLRFKPVLSKTDAPIDLEIVRLDGDKRDVQTARFATKGINDSASLFGGSAFVQQVTDGHSPTVISYARNAGDPTKLVVQPPAIAADRWTYNVDADGQALAYAFPAPTTAQHTLINGKPPDAIKDKDVTHYDLPVGEYGDVFRFQLEKNAERATFTVRPMAQGTGVGAVDIALPPTAKSLTLKSGDPRTITFDLGGGASDLVIYDRLEAGADPASKRTHVLTLTGPALPKETAMRFLAIGELQSGHSTATATGDHAWDKRETVDAVMAAQADQGDFAGFEQRIDAALLKARKDALDKGILQKGTYDAWQKLSLLLTELDGERATVAKDRTKTIDKDLVKRCADAAKALHDTLDAESLHAAQKQHGRPANQFTKRAKWNHRPGAGINLQHDLLAHAWASAEADYASLLDGLDMYITHQLKTQVSDEAGQQHEYLRGVSKQMHAIEKHNPLRIYGTFTPDEDKQQHVPLNLFVYKDRSEWHLVDLTNPKDPFDDTVDATNAPFPPDALFQKLNWKKHFPVGVVHFRLPGGRDGTVACTGKRKWYDWFADISLALAVVGITALTAGAGTVAAFAFAGAGIAGAVAAGGDLQDSISHNHADGKTVLLDVAQIAGGFLGAGQVLGGRLIRVAAAADEAVTAGAAGAARFSGAWASLAGVAGRTYLPITVGSAVSNGVTLAVMTTECLDAIATINANKTMSPDEKRASLTRVIGQFLIVGGITFMAVKGDVATALEGRPQIEVVNIHGEPVVVTAGTIPVLRPKIGETVAADGSLTKTGKQRLAELPTDTRKRLLGLDQQTMGKLLTLDEPAFAKLTKVDDVTLKKLGAHLDEAAFGRVGALDEAGLKRFLDLDRATMTDLASLPGLSNVLKLSRPELIAQFRRVPGPLRAVLADASAPTIELVLARPHVLDGLGKLKPEAAKPILTKLDPLGANGAELWNLPFQKLMDLALGLDGTQLAHLVTLPRPDLAKVTALHTHQVGNLATMPPADLGVVAKMDEAAIEDVSRVPGDHLVTLSPMTEAKARAKVADVEATDADSAGQLTNADGHLRQTNFFDRDGERVQPATGGEVKILVPNKKGTKMTEAKIEAPKFVVLEVIPSPPAPTRVIIKSVEVTGRRVPDKTAAGPGKIVTGPAQPNARGQLMVPSPGQPDIRVVVETNLGKAEYTNPELPPVGTRVAVDTKQLVADGVSGGHTRSAWEAAANRYGDMIKQTNPGAAEPKIEFSLPGSSKSIKMAAIDYQAATTTTTGNTITKTHAKTIFEETTDLGHFETHARPYMSAKIDSLKSAPPPDGTIITVDVPVKTMAGAEAVIKLEFPWRLDRGKFVLRTWWIGKSSFAKGSPFNR